MSWPGFPDALHPRRFVTPPATRVLMAVLTLLMVAGLATVFGEWLIASGRKVFVTADVALVTVVSALPLALFLSDRGAYHRWIRGLLLTGSCIGIGSVLIGGRFADESSVPATFFSLSLARTTCAVGLAIAATWTLCALCGTSKQMRACRSGRAIAMRVTLGVLIAIMLPMVYVHARYRHDERVLDDLLDQSRIGEALVLARELVALVPTTEEAEGSLIVKHRAIEREIHLLESQVAEVVQDRSAAQQLRYCQQLAMLDRTADALSGLTPLFDSDIRVSACELSGVIYEKKANWAIARDFHLRAQEHWLAEPSRRARQAGLANAAARLGYCERKLGNHEAAEAEYRALLDLAPTAENHFLVAQFYEDIQQSTRARIHAHEAITRDPRRYQLEGTKLINRLVVGQFGCLHVFSAAQSDDPE